MRPLALLIASLSLLSVASAWEIEHVVLLLMENRPFDFFFGFAQDELGDINGLTGDECMTDGDGGEECVEEGGANYVCKAGGTMSYGPMVNEIFGADTTWDGFSPICDDGLPQPDMCADGVNGNADAGTACVFPFIYNGEKQYSCVSSGEYGGQGWCGTTSDYDTDKEWGGCTYCEAGAMCTNGVGTVEAETPCVFPFTDGDDTYTACKGTDYGSYGWCATTSDYENDNQWGGCKVCGETYEGCRTAPKDQPQDGWMVECSGTSEVIAQFSPDEVPIHTALAEEFAVFDKYYTSFPGPSTPNHLFIMTATSGGCSYTGQDYMCESGAAFPQKTVFENLEDNNMTWRYFYNDSTWNYFVEWFNTPRGVAGIQGYDEFYHRAETGTLPNFSLILPRQGENATTGQGSNDDHPCHDIALGERLMKDTYEALRAGPGWNKTLFLITYDDTGGWYDHAPVPTEGVPRPDDVPSCATTTNFDWLGLRAPSLLISPWISKGKVIHEPDGPEETSQYEHSSVSATLKNVFGLDSFLTRRDAWAGSFEKELDLDQPRTDCPMHLPSAPEPDAKGGKHGCVEDPDLTRRQRRRMTGMARTNKVDTPDLQNMKQVDVEQWIIEQEHIHRANVVGRSAYDDHGNYVHN